MIIVLFHVLYLLGKYVYQNYQVKKRNSVNDAVNEIKTLVISESDYRMRDPEAPQDDEERVLKFFPPAYVQRYVAVSEVLNSAKYQGKLRKVVDFGCAELNFLVYLKNTPGIEEILCVDIDRSMLEFCKEKAAPLIAEYLHTRATPLVVEICEGSITHNDAKLEKTDAVICIELIEHLYPDALTDLPRNIFGFIKPKVAIITTPNADFNVLFPFFSGIRHPDHKFEWTRQEFQEWAENVILRYPDYVVTFDGITKGPEGSEHLGCCTQMATFHRVSEKDSCSIGVKGLFKTVAVHEYPFHVDNRSDEQKILDEATYYIRQLSSQDSDMEEEVPLKQLLEMLKLFHISVEALKTILEEAGWSIMERENGPVVLIPPRSTFSDYSAVEEAFWPGYSGTDNEDEWSREPGPPVNSRCLNQESCLDTWDDQNFDEEPSIVIPQIHSAVEDNTYLFDGENALDSVPEVTKDSKKCTEPDPTEDWAGNSSLSSNVDDFNGSFHHNVPSDLNQSVMYDSFFHAKLDDIQEDLSLDLIHPLDAPVSAAKKSNRTLEFQAFMSCSQASTSPEPFLLQTIKMDRHLRNESMCNQSMSEYWPLNNSCDQTDASKETKDKKLSPINDTEDNVYLNGSCKENEDLNSTNESARCITDLTRAVPQHSSSLKEDSQLELNSSASLACSSAIVDLEPQFTSSPKMETKTNTARNKRAYLSGQKNGSNSSIIKQFQPTSLNNNNSLDTSVEVSLPSNSDISISALSTVSYTALRKWCNEDECPASEEDKQLNSSKETDSDASTIACSLNSDRNAIKQLSINSSLSEDEPTGVASNCDTEFQLDEGKTEAKAESQTDSNNTEAVQTDAKDVSNLCISASVLKDDKCSIVGEEECKDVDPVALEVTEHVDAKPSSPEAVETPPNSWSPEIMDSGYPHSASAQDITPESSIAQDQISDSEPPSIAEAPVLEALDDVNVDLANNNRDDEDNNMMAEELNDLEHLQLLIDVLEHDLENANGIYAQENDFPIWLLRILNMANPVDDDMQMRRDHANEFPADEARYANMEHDEGFDSTSEDDSDLESNEMVDDNVDANEDAVMASVENDNENSDSGSDQMAVGET